MWDPAGVARVLEDRRAFGVPSESRVRESPCPSSARSLIARTADQGTPRAAHAAATDPVSMSTAITPSAMSASSRAGSMMKSSEVTIVPRAVGASIGAGWYGVPVVPSTTTWGITTSPMPTLGPTPPAIPTTTTRSNSPRPSSRSVARVASAVPMPVVVAITSALPTVPVCTAAPLIDPGSSANAFTMRAARTSSEPAHQLAHDPSRHRARFRESRAAPRARRRPAAHERRARWASVRFAGHFRLVCAASGSFLVVACVRVGRHAGVHRPDRRRAAGGAAIGGWWRRHGSRARGAGRDRCGPAGDAASMPAPRGARRRSARARVCAPLGVPGRRAGDRRARSASCS